MRKYQDKDLEKAQNLRTKYHYSFTKLQEITGIPATTIRNWCKHDNSSTRWDTLLKTYERRRNDIKTSEKDIIKNFKIFDKTTAKILVSIIYWCEGSKYPSTNKLDMTNSDPLLLQLFIRLLRISFPLNEAKFRVKLQIHSTQNFNEISKYWSNLLKIPTSQFIKPTITIPRGKKYRKDYMGTCTIRYSDYKIQLKVIGIYEQFDKIINIPGGVA